MCRKDIPEKMAGQNDDVPCAICRKAERDDLVYGEWLTKSKISLHYFCLLFSNKLPQLGSDKAGFFGFQIKDIQKFVKGIPDTLCDYCHDPNASVFCAGLGCHRKFHLICGLKNGCLLNFCENFPAFCSDHYPGTFKSFGANENFDCTICDEPLPAFHIAHTIPSCCDRGWYHVNCLRQFALSAGYYFGCLHCRQTTTDRATYRATAERLGVYVPQREASWETKTNFASLNKILTCGAQKCRYSSANKIPIIRCDTCGAFGMHLNCARGEFNDRDLITFTCVQCQLARASTSSTRPESSLDVSLEDPPEDDEWDGLNTAFNYGSDVDSHPTYPESPIVISSDDD